MRDKTGITGLISEATDYLRKSREAKEQASKAEQDKKCRDAKRLFKERLDIEIPDGETGIWLGPVGIHLAYDYDTWWTKFLGNEVFRFSYEGEGWRLR